MWKRGNEDGRVDDLAADGNHAIGGVTSEIRRRYAVCHGGIGEQYVVIHRGNVETRETESLQQQLTEKDQKLNSLTETLSIPEIGGILHRRKKGRNCAAEPLGVHP